MATFVTISGGRLFQIDTEQEPVIVTPSAPSAPAAQTTVSGSLSVAKNDCGCIAIFQIFYDYGGALITEASTSNINSPDLQPFVTEDGLFYIITEQSDMADPVKVSELTEAAVNDIVANLDTAEILLSLDTGAGYVTYKLTFEDLIDVIKTAITTGKLTITMVGSSGTSATLVGKNILDAELNEQNIAILSAVPVSGEQGLYVNTATGAYEIYNVGDTTGLTLKIIYSNT